MKKNIANARKFFWHLRAGGPMQVRTWLERESYEAGHRKLETIRGAEGAWTGRGKRRRLQFKPTDPSGVRGSDRLKPRVAVILDEFSALGFDVEWDCIPLSPKAWREDLAGREIDFLFVESVWHGRSGLWAGKMARTEEPGVLAEIVGWCNEHDIPTVFWNKEDPPHYLDFLPAAKLFDFVFTSDAGRIPSYREDLGHENIAVLPFGAQPAVHNPVRPRFGWHSRDVAFGGMYFTEKYPERRQQLDMLLGAATAASDAMPTGLEIFSRQSGGDTRYTFPDEYAPRVVGSLDYPQMLTAYKAYKTFLNVNSVVDSSTMCSRRVFEIVAAGAAVVTTPSPAIETYFRPDEIFTVSSEAEAEQLLRALQRNPAIAERQLHRGQRRIWKEHTYQARSNRIIELAVPGMVVEQQRRHVSVLVSTIRPWQLEHVFRTVGSQRDVDVELVLLTHGFTADGNEIRKLQEQFGVSDVKILKAERSESLGACLNQCVEAASGEVLTKMDDDDFYAPDYLSDQLYALHFSGADVVGKQAHYMYLERRNATILRFPEWEHRYTRTVMGPTIMGSAGIFQATLFDDVGSGEDSLFLKRVIQGGGSIYAADRFNYCQQRYGEGHTWQVSEEALLATGDVKFFGNYRDEVSV
ncbi:glycosyltransferase family protein [Pseudarthrobacter sp. J47]|uniref:glycosyltransferase family protein n=1 Tax=Pseudarthrobacter sp. J47 TaxID=3116482 RepID=UPI002E823837|nr:glycosyltransferase [Pseudarthrobacter sp. J47]MEE2524057.1 glycosyltransferase [Pseudarthrobacter sp. J47]